MGLDQDVNMILDVYLNLISDVILILNDLDKHLGSK